VSQARVANRSLAVFGQATIKLDRFVRGLSATLGARMNWDNRYRALLNRTLVDGAPALCKFTLDTDGNPATPEIRPDITNCILPGRKSFSKPTYNLGVDYKIDPDHLVYFAHRHGYRSGGLDIRANSSATNEIGYRPEIVDDLEVGIKADWHFGNKYLLRTNLAAYQSSFKDIQRIVLIPGSIPPVNLTTNAAKGRIRGFEAEATLRTGPLFELTGFYSYTDAKYLNYVTPLGQDLSGFPFALAPKNIYGATVHVNIPMDDKIGHPYLHAKYSHSDGYSDFDVQDIFSFIKGSDVVDLTIGMEKVGGSGLDVAFYVRNLFDEVYYTPWYHNVTLGFGTQHPEMPRSFGVRAQYKF
jgi:iron complex outermembrane receptor protein